jgi:hypothetical protein
MVTFVKPAVGGQDWNNGKNLQKYRQRVEYWAQKGRTGHFAVDWVDLYT